MWFEPSCCFDSAVGAYHIIQSVKKSLSLRFRQMLFMEDSMIDAGRREPTTNTVSR
jgi:hypothetical protein